MNKRLKELRESIKVKDEDLNTNNSGNIEESTNRN